MLDGEFKEVLGAAQAGADWAWRKLYDEVAGQLLGYARAQGAKEPEDVVGEVMVQLARNLRTFEGDEPGFRSWVFTVAHHRVIDERRRIRRRPVDPVEEIPEDALGAYDVTSDEAVASVRTEWVWEVIDQLVPAQRDVLLLRIVAGLTVREIADATGRTEGAVKALQRRGLLAIQRLLPEEGIPE